MSIYTNAKCPYCEKNITDSDDLAVCPVCGTPHHRNCYFEHGHCFNESLHKEGFEWTPPASDGETVLCGVCGKITRKDGAFCNYCGSPVNTLIADGMGGMVSQPRDRLLLGTDAAQSPYNLTEDIDGISIKDWIAYIGQNFNYYLYNFKAQDRMKKKLSFTFSAAMLPPLYFLYRRVWGAAILSAIINFLFNIPAMVLYGLWPNGLGFGLSLDTWERMSGICSILGIFVNMAWGLFAVWLYRKKAVRHMGRLKSESVSGDEYEQRIHRVSGPSKTAIVVLTAVFLSMVFLSAVLSVLA